MTLTEFYKNYVLPLMAEKQSSAASYQEQYVGVINAVLCELFPLNNLILRARGLAEVEEFAPYGAGDELPYAADLLISCAAYGAASRLYVDEAGDEANMVGFLESCFEAGKRRFAEAHYVKIKNVFDREE